MDDGHHDEMGGESDVNEAVDQAHLGVKVAPR
jgi:hypothetical protein